MASSIAANKAELLAIANAVATEKMIDKSIVIEALEEAIQRAARARYGAENDIRAKLDTQTGDLRLWRVVEVVEDVEDYFKQVDLKQADKLQKGAVVGDFIVDPLPAVDLGRIDAQSAKQVIFQKVRDAERERQFEEFKDRTGEIITGVVKSVEFGHVVVDLGRAEGVIRRDQQIPREVVRSGDRGNRSGRLRSDGLGDLLQAATQRFDANRFANAGHDLRIEPSQFLDAVEGLVGANHHDFAVS